MAQDFGLGNLITPKHFVRFYDDDNALVKEITQFIGTGLAAGHGGIVIATPAHVTEIERRLLASGCEIATAKETGQYVALDAAATLSRFMVNGWPDDQRFHEVVGGLIRQAEHLHSWVRAFGEMVALLWAEQKQDAALHLEKLWNDLANSYYSFSLFCAYPIKDFDDDMSRHRFKDVCTEHSRILMPDRVVDQRSPTI